MSALDAAILRVDTTVRAWVAQSPRSVYRAGIVIAWKQLLVLLAPYRHMDCAGDPLKAFDVSVLNAYRAGISWPDLMQRFNRAAEVKDLPNALEIIHGENNHG
ncbi:MAG: hypothetical protein R3E60_06925 [Alphaproteobacteria bacterium]